MLVPLVFRVFIILYSDQQPRSRNFIVTEAVPTV